jgi:hypothetical protein
MHLICQRKLNSYYAQDNYPFGEDITWADNKMNNNKSLPILKITRISKLLKRIINSATTFTII